MGTKIKLDRGHSLYLFSELENPLYCIFSSISVKIMNLAIHKCKETFKHYKF